MNDPHWSGNHKDAYYTSIPVQTVVDWKSNGPGDRLGEGNEIPRWARGKWTVEVYCPNSDERFNRAVRAFQSKRWVPWESVKSAGMDRFLPHTERFTCEWGGK